MNVMKFGGTSVGSAERIKNVAQLIMERGKNVIVLSAMSGTTNSLVEISDYLYKQNIDGAKETINNLECKYYETVKALFEDTNDRQNAAAEIKAAFNYIRSFTKNEFTLVDEKEILAQGELISTALMNIYLKSLGVKSVLISALDYMRIDSNEEPDTNHIKHKLNALLDKYEDAEVYITQGYICRNSYGDIDNLKRGGSDYSASLIGAAINAGEIEIWTDIDGMHNNDPRFVEGTEPVGELHFEEAAELAYFGAKILHPTCVLPAKLSNIPIRLLNTMCPKAKGTLISNGRNNGKIKAVAAKDNITAIRIKSGRLLLAYGFLHKVFETFETYKTQIDTMAMSEVAVSVTVDNTKYLDNIVDELKKFATVSVDEDMVIICVVGDLNWINNGLEAEVLSALKDIPVRMISYGGSDHNISVLVKKEDKLKALNSLSDKLFRK